MEEEMSALIEEMQAIEKKYPGFQIKPSNHFKRK